MPPKRRSTTNIIISSNDREDRPIFTNFDFIQSFDKNELHKELRKFSLPVNGSIAELRARLLNFFERGYSNDTTMEEAERPPELTRNQLFSVSDLVRKWNHTFNGRTDAVTFLERLEELQESYSYTGRQLLSALPEMLREGALMWYRNNKQEMKTWEDFLAQFKLFYLPRNYLYDLEEEIIQRKQRNNETGREYLTTLQTLLRRHGGFSSDQILYRLYNNLTPQYRQYIRRSSLRSIGDLVREIEEFEKLQEDLRRSAPRDRPREPFFPPQNSPFAVNKTNPFPVPSFVKSSPPRPTPLPVENNTRVSRIPICFRCSEEGHLATFCKNPRKLFCIICRKDGVATKDCCQSKGNEK